MNEEQYMTEWVDNQIEWYDKESTSNQNWYKTIRTLVIIVSVLIPLFAGFLNEKTLWMKFAIGAAGALVAILESILTLRKYKDNWIQYRSTCENLQREKRFFLTESGRYENIETPFKLFVKTVETITSDENVKWIENMVKEEESSQA